MGSYPTITEPFLCVCGGEVPEILIPRDARIMARLFIVLVMEKKTPTPTLVYQDIEKD